MTTASQQEPLAPGRRRLWTRVAVPAGLLLIAAVLVGVVALIQPHQKAAPVREAAPVNVQVERVAALPELADTFDITAVVEPNRVVKVAAEVPGRIERFGRRSRDVTWRGRVIPRESVVDEGEPVTAGEPLVHLNQDLLQARFTRAQAQFEYDEREYRRILDLYERGNTSKSELDDARTKRDVSRATLDEAARELERTTIAAPISGILNRLPRELGEYAKSGDIVAEIVDLDPVKVVVDVSERDVPYLSVGNRATVLLSNGEPQERTGDLTYINAIADEGTRTTRVEITVANDDYRLHSGQIVKARLTRRVLKDVIMVPLESVIPLEEGMIVYVARDGAAERRDVTLGFIKGRRVRALSGLTPGDLLIVTGHRYVGHGQRVTIVEPPAAQTRPADATP
jgi:RND family efflux transporter MFP subunit